jgi:hypothetical protein
MATAKRRVMDAVDAPSADAAIGRTAQERYFLLRSAQQTGKIS